jgi:hypothetical protein
MRHPATFGAFCRIISIKEPFHEVTRLTLHFQVIQPHRFPAAAIVQIAANYLVIH